MANSKRQSEAGNDGFVGGRRLAATSHGRWPPNQGRMGPCPNRSLGAALARRLAANGRFVVADWRVIFGLGTTAMLAERTFAHRLAELKSTYYYVIMLHRKPVPANPANIPSARFFPHIGIAANMRVLDVGCGNGDLSRIAAALVGPGGEVVGIDRSEGALASARAVPAAKEIAPIHYQTVDLSGELPDLGLFDAIIGRRVLMYLPDAAATLARLAQLAKPYTIIGFQEHARGDLPTGAGDLPVHRECYRMVWDTVVAEKGDATLGYRLARLISEAGFTIEHARSEGVLIQPWEESFLPTLTRLMLPRMIEHGIVREEDVDVDALADRIDTERRAVNSTIFWDMAFLVSGRFESFE